MLPTEMAARALQDLEDAGNGPSDGQSGSSARRGMNSSDEATPIQAVTDSARKWLTVLLLVAPINAMLVFDRVALIVVTPILQKELQLTLVDTSVLISAVMWSYALLQIPAGWSVTRFGIKAMMFGALLLWSTVTILTPLAQTFYGLILLRLLLGIGQSPDWPASVAAVRSWFGPTERSKGTSILLAGQYIGSALAAPVTTFIVVRTSWHMPFYIYGTVGLVLTAMWFLYYRDRRVSASTEEAPPPLRAKIVFAALLRSPQFWSLGGTYACIAFTACFINYMLPQYLIDHRGVDYQLMGLLVGLPSVFLWGSVFVAGFFADAIVRKTGSIWKARVPLGCVGSIVAGLAAGATDWVDGIVPMAACLCLSFFALGFAQITLWSMAQDLTKHYTGVLTGWASAWGNLLAAAGPIAIAHVVQSTGSWKVGLALPVVGGLLGALMIWSTKPHKPLEEIAATEP